MSSSWPSYGGLGPTTLWIMVAEFIVTSIVFGLRIFASFRVVRRPRLDLLWISIAYILSVIALAFGVLCVLHGMANHIRMVQMQDITPAILYDWIFNCATIMSVAFGKFAVVALILQVQGRTHPKMRYLMYFIAGSTMLFSAANTIVVWFQCTPAHVLWTDPANLAACPRTLKVLYYGTFTGSWSTASDFVLAACPAYIFWNLEISWRRRLTLIGLFCGGAIAGVSAIFKTIYILRMSVTVDATWSITPLIICAATEMHLIIIMSSIPSIHPLAKQLVRKARGLPTRTDYSYGKSGGLASPGARLGGTFGSTAEEKERFHRTLRPDLLGPDSGHASRTTSEPKVSTDHSSSEHILLHDVPLPSPSELDRNGIILTKDLEVKSTYQGSTGVRGDAFKL